MPNRVEKKSPQTGKPIKVILNLSMIILISVVVVSLRSMGITSSWHKAGLINVSLGFVLLASYLSSRILKNFKLPLISACIFTGILAGPYVCSFLTLNMVKQLRLVDDLALSFIALTAGGELSLRSLRSQKKALLLNILLLTVIVFLLVFLFIVSMKSHFSFTKDLSALQVMVMAIILGIIAVARSPSSAIAIISESKAKGLFTDTVLGVTIVMDVLIIILFTIALSVSEMIVLGSSVIPIQEFLALFAEIILAIGIGLAIGKGIALYIKRVGHDLPLFLLFLSFAVAKASLWFSHFMEGHFLVSLHLEPLLMCMSAGFFVRNYSKEGKAFMDNLDRLSLPIYVLFFSLAGAALDLSALVLCWPIALSLVFIRILGIFLATFSAERFSGHPPQFSRYAWMAYITQAGVAIGLAQLTARQFPEIGGFLITIVLAVISINQVVGPITFKIALNLVKETGKR